MSNKSDALLETLDAVHRTAEKDTTTFGTIVDAIEERGYGPLVMVLAAFVVLPTGAIPGVPAIVGIALVLVAGQLLIGRQSPWLPRKLRSIELPRDKLENGVDRARPWARRLSAILSQRLSVFTDSAIAQRAEAVCVIAGGLVMVPLGFVPLLPAGIGVALLFIGLGMTARDGAVILIGYVIFAVALWLAITQLIA